LMRENKNEDVSYFGFPLIVKETAPFTRNQITEYLEKNKIGTRNVFSGNLLRHPAYLQIKRKIKLIGPTKNSDIVMNNAFWIGVWPGIDEIKIEYIKKCLRQFLSNC